MKRMSETDQRLALEYGRMSLAKRKAARKVYRRAQKMSGMSRREFAEALQAHDEEAVGFMQAAASKNDKWMEHFQPEGFLPSGDEDRDWSEFFNALMDCMERFLPLILAL